MVKLSHLPDGAEHAIPPLTTHQWKQYHISSSRSILSVAVVYYQYAIPPLTTHQQKQYHIINSISIQSVAEVCQSLQQYTILPPKYPLLKTSVELPSKIPRGLFVTHRLSLSNNITTSKILFLAPSVKLLGPMVKSFWVANGAGHTISQYIAALRLHQS